MNDARRRTDLKADDNALYKHDCMRLIQEAKFEILTEKVSVREMHNCQLVEMKENGCEKKISLYNSEKKAKPYGKPDITFKNKCIAFQEK